MAIAYNGSKNLYPIKQRISPFLYFVVVNDHLEGVPAEIICQMDVTK